MNTGPWSLEDGSGGGGAGPAGLAGGPTSGDAQLDDLKPPRRMAWLWLLIGVVVLAGAGAGGWILYKRQQEQRAMEDLLAASADMPPEERADALRKVLQSHVHPSFRADAATALGELRDPRAAPALLSVVTDTEELSQAAAIALGRIADAGNLSEGDANTARDRIFVQMGQAEGMAKTHFAFALALLRDQRCIEALIQGYIDNQQARSIEGLDARLVAAFVSAEKMVELSKSSDSAVRMFAAQTLGEMKAAAGVDALAALLADQNESVVQTAAEALAKTDPNRAGPELIKLMQSRPALQQTLVVALRDAVGAPGLQPVYENTQDWELRLKLIQHVRAPPPPGKEAPNTPRGIGDPRGAEMCEHFYKNYPADQPVLREYGLWCLEDLGDPRAAEGLFKVAAEPFSQDRDAIIDGAIKSIGYLKLPGAQEFLVDLLKQHTGRPATILGALGRVGDASVAPVVERFTVCPEADVLSGGDCDKETAFKVLGRLHAPGALKLLTETAERRSTDIVATKIESRDIWQEPRLRDRISSLQALAFLGDPGAAETVMTILEDTSDDPEVRFNAAQALAYSVDDTVVATILSKVADDTIDVDTRKYFVAALWHRPNPSSFDALFRMLESDSTPSALLMSAGLALGEAGDTIDQERLRRLLNHQSNEHAVPAALAALMSGDDDTIAALLRAFEERQGLEAQVTDRYAGEQGHPIYITPELFSSGRLYRRLRNADLLRQADEGAHGWAWQHLMGRLLAGTVEWPNGMCLHEILVQLAQDVRTSQNAEWQRLAALALLRMGYRGYVLMLAAEDGPGAEVAQRVLAGRR